MNKTTNNAIEVKYDGIKNITYEFLEKAVINANIGNPNLSVSDTIISITPMRFYEGKVLDDSAKIGFRITISGPDDYVSNFYYHIEKIVIVFDEERLEVEFGEKGSENTEEYAFSQTEIVGLNKTNVPTHVKYKHVWDEVWKDFVLQPADIKRIAEAHEVGMYIDAFTLLDANGGDINFRDGGGRFQIEGIQGTMKRAYHYFLDETCYADYCASFLKRKQMIVREEKQRIEKEKQIKDQQLEQQKIQQEQAEKEAFEQWRRARNRNLVVLVISLVIFIISMTFEGGFLLWFPSVGAAVFCFVRILMLYGYTGDGSNGNDNF